MSFYKTSVERSCHRVAQLDRDRMSEAGQPHSFEAMTQVHIDALWRTAARMTGSRDVADDLVQETCLRAYRAFADFEVGTNYKAWLFRILTNLCRDHGRRESRAPFRNWDDLEVDLVTANNNDVRSQPDGELQSREFARDAQLAMDRLPANIRMVVSLSLLRELNYSEIAQIMDIPIGTVRSRLSRGRMQLQRELLEHSSASLSDQKKRCHATELADPKVAQLVPKLARQKC